MVGREMLPLGFDHSIYSDALDELVEAAKQCPMTRTEQRCFVDFIASERTHGFLFSTRAIPQAIGFSVVITLQPGYLRLMSALRAGAPQTMALIQKELERRHCAQRGAA